MSDPIIEGFETTFRDFVTDGVPSSGKHKVKKSDARKLGVKVSDAIGGAAAGNVGPVSSWAQLAAIAPTRNGQPGYVTTADAGSHTDPVVGGTVPNSGTFAGSLSPLGWRRVGAYIDVSSKADQTALDATNEVLDDEMEERSALLERGTRKFHAFSDPHGFSKVVLAEDGTLMWRDGQIIDDPRWAFAVKDRYGFVASYVDLSGTLIDRDALAPSTLASLADDAKPLLPELLVGIQGWSTKLRLKQAMPVRKDEDWFTASLFVAGTSNGVTPTRETESRSIIDFGGFSGSAMLSVRRDGISNVRQERSLNIVTAPSTAPGGATTQTCMLIGDSISNREIAKLIDLKLGNFGYTVNWTGTMIGAGIGDSPSGTGGELGEAREGWETGDYTNDVTDRVTIVAPGGEAAYLALSKSAKSNINPILRVSTGGDDPTLVCNGKIFDFVGYLSRFALTTPSVVAIGSGTNDIRDRQGAQLVEFYERGLTIMARQIRAASAATYIIFWMPPSARKLDRDDLWPEYASLIRAQMRVKTALADPKIIVCPVWALASSEIDWNDNTSVIDPDTGVDTRGLSDGIHPGSAVRHQIAESLGAIIAAISAGQI